MLLHTHSIDTQIPYYFYIMLVLGGFFLLCYSVAKSCLTLSDPMNCSTPGLPVPHYLPEFTQVRVHWIGGVIQPSHPLPPSSPFAFSLAAAAKSLQSYPTLCNPIDGSPPGSPSLGFSRQEHWSGLPFPSPMHESEKWKWSRSVVSDS